MLLEEEPPNEVRGVGGRRSSGELWVCNAYNNNTYSAFLLGMSDLKRQGVDRSALKILTGFSNFWCQLLRACPQ